MAINVNGHNNHHNGRARNRLLAALPREDWERLSVEARAIEVRAEHIIHKAGEPITHVYFPTGGVFTITTPLPEGTIVEAATVGDEGMLGIEAFFSSSPVTPGHSFLQVPSDAGLIQIAVEPFRRELARGGALYGVVSTYAQSLIAHMMQLAACNAVHSLRQRYARWLLMTRDRIRHNSFYLSQEFLAVTLGAQRPSITKVASVLQDEGVIRYVHGTIEVLDRERLEAAACSCYMSLRNRLIRTIV